jgi:FMN phosphatase YigB (HAD superfamily)
VSEAGSVGRRIARLRRLNQAQQALLAQQQAEILRLHAERADLLERLHSEQQRLRDWAGWLDKLEGTLREILSSTSWRIGKPIRLLRHLLRLDLPMLRATLAREPDPLASSQRPFTGSAIANLESAAPPRRALPWPGLVWPGTPKPQPHSYWRAVHKHPEGAWLGELVDLDADCAWEALAPAAPAQPASETDSGMLLVHIHLHAATATDWLRERCSALPTGCLIALSAPDARCLGLARNAIRSVTRVVHEQLAPEPLFALAGLLGAQAGRQGLVLHLATGPCAHASDERDLAAVWQSLLGKPERVARIRALLGANPQIAVLATQTPAHWPDWQQAWLNLRGLGEQWAAELGIDALPSGRFGFPQPALFWARIPALAQLTRIADKTPHDAVHASLTLHEAALARLLPALTAANGQQCAYLVDPQHPGWSPHRIEHTLLAGEGRLRRAIAERTVRTVAFDIFDTLVTRPLLDPERIKHLVARNHGGEAAEHYLRWRAEAEQRARAAAGRDVALDLVYRELGRIAPLDEADLARLRALEEHLERRSCAARPQAQALIDQAIALGKRVVLISDMFLPRATVEALLADSGLGGWQALYLSSEVGVRKDSGLLYQHVLECEACWPASC